MMGQQEAIADARKQGDWLMDLAAQRAERDTPAFTDIAIDFAVQFLRGQPHPVSSEIITNAAKRAGIRPPDDRAFGAVYATAARRGLIRWAGSCKRFKGHGTRGGSLWELAPLNQLTPSALGHAGPTPAASPPPGEARRAGGGL